MVDLMPEEEAATFVPEPLSDGEMGEMIRRLKDVREQQAELKKDEAALRAELLRALDLKNGSFRDEQSGLVARIKSGYRYEWDAELLRQTGELKDSEIAECLRSVVDKKTLEDRFIVPGTARSRMLESAKVVTSRYETLTIQEEKPRAR